MDSERALEALAALGQATRLDVYRLLVRVGPDGLPAGEIARRLGTRQNTLSTHLAILGRSGLVEGRRDGRTIRFAARLETMRALVAFLVEDCCGGRPEQCRSVLEMLDLAC